MADAFRIDDHATDDTGRFASEEEAAPVLQELLERLADLSDRFAAQGTHALLIVLQGFDGAGKDRVISTVLHAIDPSVLHVFSFNTPVGDEVAHDFLWRFHQQTPARGRVHAFDRSYYEEVIGARVHGVVDEEEVGRRCESINDFERILHRDRTLIAKFFLHVDKDVQAERVRERLHDRTKHHEFSAADVEDRERWDDFDRAYEDAIGATDTDDAPWEIVPADHRWFACVRVAERLVAVLEELDPQYPPLDEDEVREAGLDPDELETG